MVLHSLFIKSQLSHRTRVSQMLHGQGSGHVYSVQGQPMITKSYWTKINWHFRPKVTSFLCGVHTGWILCVPIIMKQFMCWHGSPTNQSILFPTQWGWVNVNAAPLSSSHYSSFTGSRKPQPLPIAGTGAAATLPWDLGAGSFLPPALCPPSEPSESPGQWTMYEKGDGICPLHRAG